jgi:hypothetical protein
MFLLMLIVDFMATVGSMCGVRRSEAELWREFGIERPRILGALLDALVHGLRAFGSVHLNQLPRMADFALWTSACEPIGVELADRKAAAGCKTAEGIGEPARQAGQVVECEDIAVVGRNHQLALLARERPLRGGIGVDQSLEQFGENRFCGALLAGYRQKRIGTI